jgi:MscS family membrane protein
MIMMRRGLLPVAVLLSLAAAVLAQEIPPGVELSSPRTTMRTFLDALPREGAHDLRAAVACLDTSRLPGLTEAERRELAYQLKEVLDRTRLIKILEIPPTATGDPYVFEEFRAGSVVISQTSPPAGPWLFSAETVAALGDILEEARGRTRVAGREHVPFSVSPALWLRSRMPESLLAKGFLLEHWQWLVLLALSVLGILVERLVTAVVPALLRGQLRRRRLDVDATTARTGLRPFGLLAMTLTWMAFIGWAGLPPQVARFLMAAVRFLAALAGLWSAYRLVEVVSDVLRRRARATETRFDDLLVPLFRKSLKVFVTAVGLVFIASVLEIKVTSLLAGLGLGGIAFALAAKDTVANLFGSVTIVLDRPFHVGDWVRIGDEEGTVAEVGFRSTRVRTFYNSQISIPNGNLISAVVDNMGARRYRRIKTMIGLTYDTPPEKIEAFCEGVRELIRRHPYTRKDYFHVYLNAFAASSLDVLLYAFVETPDWGTELREKHRLYADIVRLAERLGVEFAFPTRTVHMVREPEGVEGEPSPARAADLEHALGSGRLEARRIIDGTLGDPPARPPPVSFDLPETELRGDDS